MILGHNEIHNRIARGQVFRRGTWDPDCIKEASYVLRIADDGLLLDGKFYDPFDRKRRYQGDYIVIAPGKIAILSTKEELVMPSDLVGKIGIRLEFALLGLTGLMGIQVDPHFGEDKEHERLYIRVANFGNKSINLSPGDGVFTFELHEVAGYVPRESKEDSWPRIKRYLRELDDASWSYVTQVEQDLTAQTENIREYLQPLVLFGVFLVAVTILGVSLTVILTLGKFAPNQVPPWVTWWGWIILLVTLSLATLATALVGFASAWRLFRPYRFNKHPLQKHSQWTRGWGFLTTRFPGRS